VFFKHLPSIQLKWPDTIQWQLGDPKELAFSGLFDSSLIQINPPHRGLHKRSELETITRAGDVGPTEDTDTKGHSGFFYEGYENILSKPYPTKGVKTYENYLDRERLTAAIARGAKVNDKEVQDLIAPATEELAKTDDVYERDEIMNMIWGAVMEGLLRGDKIRGGNNQPR
jgi:hypothetical protein